MAAAGAGAAALCMGVLGALLLSTTEGAAAAVNLSSAGRLLVSLRPGALPGGSGLRQRETAVEVLGAPTGAESELWAAEGTEQEGGDLDDIAAAERSPPSVNAKLRIPGLVQGDIIVDDDDRSRRWPGASSAAAAGEVKQDVLMGGYCKGCGRWAKDKAKRGTYRVPYAMTNEFTQSERTTMQWVFDYFAHFTNVRFAQRGSGGEEDKDFVKIRRGAGCNTFLGYYSERKHGEHELNLHSECFSPGAFVHELLHVLGVDHEHQRPDRDKHVIFHWENICNASDAEVFSNIATDITPYDFASVMQYQGVALTCDEAPRGTRTMTPKDPAHDDVVDRVKVVMSSCDIALLYQMYPGPKEAPVCQANVLPRACKPTAMCLQSRGIVCEYNCRYQCGSVLVQPDLRWMCDILTFEEMEQDYKTVRPKPVVIPQPAEAPHGWGRQCMWTYGSAA